MGMDGNTIVFIWIIMSLLHTAIITVDVAVNSGKIQMEKGKGKMKMTTKEKIFQAKMALDLCDELREVAKNCVERLTRLMRKVDNLLRELDLELSYEPKQTETTKTNT